jgi:hypothetical protein
MLFSAEKLRQLIIKDARQHKGYVFHQHVANVFLDIINEASLSKKRSDLLEMVKYIERK